MDWLASSLGKKPDNPIEVASLPAILADIKKQANKYYSSLDGLDSRNGVKCRLFFVIGCGIIFSVQTGKLRLERIMV